MTQSRLNRVLDIHDVRTHKHMTFDIQPNSEERAGLAQRCDILEVQDMNAFVSVTAGDRPDLFIVEGTINAHVVQACCVTLAPVVETIEESFRDVLTTLESALKPEDETDGDPNQPVELIQNDQIDLGDIIAQWLALSLNPYPRSDAPVFNHMEQKEESAGKYNPFAVLADIKER